MIHDFVRFGREIFIYVDTNVWGRRETFEESEPKRKMCEPRDLDLSGDREKEIGRLVNVSRTK